MTWPLKQKWFWTLFLGLLAMVLGAFAVVYVFVSLSPQYLFLLLIVVVVIWYVFRSYRSWHSDKSRGETGNEDMNSGTGLTDSSVELH